MNAAYEKVSDLYENGYTLSQIGAETGYTRQWVSQILRKVGKRDVRSTDIHHHDTVNTKFFDLIDSEEKAYFLGLMYADGNVYIGENGKRKHYTISITLQEQDVDIVQKFRDLIAPNHKLYYKIFKNGSNQWKLAFDSKIVAEQLIALGCTTKKSLTLTYPTNEQVPEELIRHFVRGYMDGDGCISYSYKKNKYPHFSVGFTSTKDFCQSLTKLLANLNLTSSSYTRPKDKRGNGITTELKISGNKQCSKLLRWLYDNAKYYLNRKHQKYLVLDRYRAINAEDAGV